MNEYNEGVTICQMKTSLLMCKCEPRLIKSYVLLFRDRGISTSNVYIVLQKDHFF